MGGGVAVASVASTVEVGPEVGVVTSAWRLMAINPTMPRQ